MNDVEYKSSEIFATFVRTRDLLLSIDGKIDSKYVWDFISKDLERQLDERKKVKK